MRYVTARSGLRSTCPGRGTRPPGRNTTAAAGEWASRPAASPMAQHRFRVAGNPCSAPRSRRQHPLQPQPAVARQHLVPRVHHAGHGYGQGTALGHLDQAALPQPRKLRSCRRPPAVVERAQAALPGIVDDPEGVATGGAVVRIDNLEHRVGGDGGVDGRPAVLEHAQAGLGRQIVRGGDETVRRQGGCAGRMYQCSFGTGTCL